MINETNKTVWFLFLFQKKQRRIKMTLAHIQYLSDTYNKQDFAKMTPDKMYAFYSAPDTGKTAMIINVLQPYLEETHKKALYLTSRVAIINQIRSRINKKAIVCSTYQRIEYLTALGETAPDNFDFIICDEAHYFIDDALLSQKTDLSFSFVNNSSAVVILLSGTPKYIECLKEYWRRPIEVMISLNRTLHNVTKICLATKRDQLHQHLEELIKKKKRIIVYDSNIAELHSLYTTYKKKETELGIQSAFICSQHRKKYKKDCNQEILETLMSTEKIETTLLFVTSALNTGISINEDFEYLFIFGCPSSTDIFQLIARMRKGETNRFWKTIFCSVASYQTLRIKKRANEDELLRVDDPTEWNTHRRSPACYAYEYNNQQFLNPMMIEKLRQDIKEFESLLKDKNVTNAYRKMFEERYDRITVITLGVFLLVNLLNQYKHLPYLTKDHQAEIKALCHAHNIQTSISKINHELTVYNCGVHLRSCQKKIDKKNIRIWHVQE